MSIESFSMPGNNNFEQTTNASIIYRSIYIDYSLYIQRNADCGSPPIFHFQYKRILCRPSEAENSHVLRGKRFTAAQNISSYVKSTSSELLFSGFFHLIRRKNRSVPVTSGTWPATTPFCKHFRLFSCEKHFVAGFYLALEIRRTGAEREYHLGVLRTQTLLSYSQRSLVHRSDSGVLALYMQQAVDWCVAVVHSI